MTFTKNKILILLFFSFSMSAFSAGWRPGFSIAIGSGPCFYGNGEASDRKNDYDLKNRMNLYTEINIHFPIGEKFFFLLGESNFYSWVWDGRDDYNIADIAFDFGMHLRPGIAGLMFGVDYGIGHRSDYVDLPGSSKKKVRSEWGNGFKISVEYDFLYKRKGFSPVIGAAWRFFPRGDDIFDNFLLFYVKIMNK